MSEHKPFSLGILVGRFQVLHAGHEQMIQTAIDLCDTRREMLRNIFGSRIQIFPLPDIGVGNTSAWGDYVLENVKSRFGRLPDLLVSGKEARRLDWFDSVEGVRIAELYIPKTIDISASQVRDFLITDDRSTWENYVNPKIHPMYDQLRETVLASKDNTDTDSI